MEKFEELGLKNQFSARTGNKELNLRNEDNKRDSVSSVEIVIIDKLSGRSEAAIVKVDPADNLAMAISILGVGRVDDHVESRAQLMAGNMASAEQDAEAIMLDYALVNLRAAMILRERNSAEAKQELEDAYALYKLAYPNTEHTLETFSGHSACKFWADNLRKVRQDPTVLGSL